MTKVLIIDDHSMTRKGLSLILEEEPDVKVCGWVAKGDGALEAIEVLEPDLAILELAIPGIIGLDLVKMMHARNADMTILVHSCYDEQVYAGPALRVGASGYVMKNASTEEIQKAIRSVLSGEVYVSDSFKKIMIQRLASKETVHQLPSEILSDREREVFEWIGRGLSTSKIAEKLNLSHKTVGQYRTRIKSKLQVGDASELVRRAMQWVEHEGIGR